ncbi:hypothetical protein I317_03821 [Kwoniella heveanensis CBS 569]|nr:hypothetical protein I317_03821 [Kwoniella heveanensis CBS 569]
MLVFDTPTAITAPLVTLITILFVHEKVEDWIVNWLSPIQRAWLGWPVTEFWLFAVLSLLGGLYNKYRGDEDDITTNFLVVQQTDTSAQQQATPARPEDESTLRWFRRIANMRKALTEWGLSFFLGFSANGLTTQQSSIYATCGDNIQFRGPGVAFPPH